MYYSLQSQPHHNYGLKEHYLLFLADGEGWGLDPLIMLQSFASAISDCIFQKHIAC
jgi:hypothetical protein